MYYSGFNDGHGIDQMGILCDQKRDHAGRSAGYDDGLPGIT